MVKFISRESIILCNSLISFQNEKGNKPLIIHGNFGSGKKLLLTKWIEYHQKISIKVI